MAKNIYKSPGVYTRITNLTFNVETVGSTFLGVAGETVKGAAFDKVPIRDFNEYKLRLGNPSPTKFKGTQIPKYEAAYIAKSYLTQSNQLFVSRVLGLSGYNAGNAWVLRALGGHDVTTLSGATATSAITVDFYVSGGTFYASADDSQLLDYMATQLSIDSSKFDGAFNTFFADSASAGFANEGLLYWGYTASGATKDAAYAASLAVWDALVTTESLSGSTVSAYEAPATLVSGDILTHFIQNETVYDSAQDRYEGNAFAIWVDSSNLNFSGSDVTGGTLEYYLYDIINTPDSTNHNTQVGVIRSNGSYISDELIMSVTGTTDLVISDGTSAGTNITADFTLSGITNNGTSFTHVVSLDPNKKSFISNVIGTDPKSTNSNIWVEEVYSKFLADGILKGTIKGVHPTLVPVSTWNHYKHQYQTPVTPFLVSELIGGEAKRLFRFVTISDGNAANTEVKVSIINVNPSTNTFEVAVRDFNDTDAKPRILERFINCNLTESSDNYIGKLIGTTDGKYSLVSEYIMVEMDADAPSEAVPAGFEGYVFRTGATFTIPEIKYKTKYYDGGEVVYDPLIGDAVITSGDKVGKHYLGFSTEFGIESDLLKFKGFNGTVTSYNIGSIWNGKTKGFHFDSGATTSDYVVGEGDFNATAVALATNPYNSSRTRKFTVCFAGGFDGWDIYRDSRTNTDAYKIGQTSFTNGGFDTFYNADLDETIGNSDYYAYYLGFKQFANPEEIAINILATPGIDVLNHKLLVSEVIDMIEEERQDAIYLPTLPDIQLLDNTTPADQDLWYYPEDVVTILNATDFDSAYASVYYPWIQYQDSDNGVNIYIPPTAEVIRNFALTDNIAFPWYATAGYSRGLVNARSTRKIKITQDVRDLLYENRVNPLMTFNDVGVVIWGNRNLQEEDSALNRINIMRLLLEARRLIVEVGRQLLFDPNDGTIRADFLREVNPILESIRNQRGLYDFRVEVSNSIEDLDTQTLSGKIFLKPIRAVEFIELDFIVTPISQSFEGL